ncbi:MAG: heme-binding protein [Verrucomicrobia bacterium]|nr:heme-binding protein [Verrucomicrobiota bacterium]
MKPFIYILFAALLALPILWLLRNSRARTETAPFKRVHSYGAIELRDYPALTLATTPMRDSRGSEAFGRLFGFITGKNAASEKIPMTTPVLIQPAHGERMMSFVLPQAVAQKGAPQPSGDVRLRTLEPGRYAVLRFKGNIGVQNQNQAAAELNAWLLSHHIAAQSEPLFAYYDPPWTPLFLRRNEVMVRVPATAQ